MAHMLFWPAVAFLPREIEIVVLTGFMLHDTEYFPDPSVSLPQLLPNLVY